MKPKNQKYAEAVLRNSRNLGTPKYKNATMEQCRHWVGIRKYDKSWDELILNQRKK